MAATLTAAAKILKEIYRPTVVDQLQSEAKATSRLERTNEGVFTHKGGKYVRLGIRTGRNHGIGARSELEALPTAGQQEYEDVQVGLKYLYGSLKVTGQSMRLANGDPAAFIKYVDKEISGLKDDLKKDFNRQFFNTAAGILATATANDASGNVITCAPPSSKYIEKGQQIDIWDASGAAFLVTNRQITAFNKTTGAITFDGAAADPDVGDTVHRTGSRNKETTGLNSIIATSGALFDVDPSSTPLWVSTVNSNSGTLRPLSESLMIQLVQDIAREGGQTSVIFCDYPVWRAYWNLLVQQRRYNDTTEFKGGVSGLTFVTDRGPIPVVQDFDCPNRRMEFVDEKQITFYRDAEWDFMDEDGAMWYRTSGFDAYQADMFCYCEFGTEKRNAHGRLEDIQEN